MQKGAEQPPERNAANAGNGGAETRPIARGLQAQAMAMAALALALIPVGWTAAYSSVIGSLAAFLPALFFAAYTVRRIGRDSAAFLQAAVVGEALKLMLTAAICMAAFRWVEPLAAGWFFTGMIAVIFAGWAGLFRGLNSGN